MKTVPLSENEPEVLISWALFFNFAAGLYLNEPSGALLEKAALFGNAMAEALPDRQFPVLFSQGTDAALDELRQEYYDLFLVPVSGAYTLPYESARRTNAPGGFSCREVGQVFATTGFDIALVDAAPWIKNIGRADYIGYELCFAAHLLSAAAEEEDRQEAENLVLTARSFYQHHLHPWLGDFGKQTAAAARSSFFKGCGELTVFLGQYFPAGGETKSRITEMTAG